jgi:hypothetical protein
MKCIAKYSPAKVPKMPQAIAKAACQLFISPWFMGMAGPVRPCKCPVIAVAAEAEP